MPKRKPGAQPGNKNAFVHGLYSEAMSKANRRVFELAYGMSPTDLTSEIATLRTSLNHLVEVIDSNYTADLAQLLADGLSRLARLTATHYHMNREQQAGLNEACASILDEIERTLGPKGH